MVTGTILTPLGIGTKSTEATCLNGLQSPALALWPNGISTVAAIKTFMPRSRLNVLSM